MESQAYQPHPQALRVTLEYREGKYQILERQLINKRVQASDPIPEKQTNESQSGSWLELRDKEGKTIYRQILHNPFGQTVEIHSPDKANPIRRETNPNPQGVLNVLIPDLPNAETMVLVSSPSQGARLFEAAQDAVQFNIRAIKEGKL